MTDSNVSFFMYTVNIICIIKNLSKLRNLGTFSIQWIQVYDPAAFQLDDSNYSSLDEQRRNCGVVIKTPCLVHHLLSLCCADLNRSLGMAIVLGGRGVCIYTYIYTHIYKNTSLRISIKHYMSFVNSLLTRRSLKVEETCK